MDNIKLIIPTEEYKEEIEKYKDEMLREGSTFDGTSRIRVTESVLDWINYCYNCMDKDLCPKDLVVSTQFICVREDDNKVIGMFQIRHELNEFLKNFGGHIGYSVVPSERRKGCATKMLSLGLIECKKLGIEDVFIMCHEENIGSEKTILNNKGVCEKSVFDEANGKNLKHYFIKTENSDENISIRKLSINDDHELYQMLKNIPKDENGFENSVYNLSYPEFKNWLVKRENSSKQQNIIDGWKVPQTIFFLFKGEKPIGYAKVQHFLTDKLKECGGHIGYTIIKSERGKGYGKLFLSKLIKECSKLGIKEPYITIQKHNIPSIKVATNLGFEIINENSERIFLVKNLEKTLGV